MVDYTSLHNAAKTEGEIDGNPFSGVPSHTLSDVTPASDLKAHETICNRCLGRPVEATDYTRRPFLCGRL
jgi:hypothetical protein